MHNEQIAMHLFFQGLRDHAIQFILWTSEAPTRLVINPDIIGRLSRVEGFYQREELKSLVPANAPVVRNIRIPLPGGELIVEIYDDYDEKFFHFE